MTSSNPSGPVVPDITTITVVTLMKPHFEVNIHFNRQCLISKYNAIRYMRSGTHYYIQFASEFRRVIHLVMCCISSFFYILVLQWHKLHVMC